MKKYFGQLMFLLGFLVLSAHAAGEVVINTNGANCKAPNSLTICILESVQEEMGFDKMIWTSSFMGTASSKDLFLNLRTVNADQAGWYRVKLRSESGWNENYEIIDKDECALDVWTRRQKFHVSDRMLDTVVVERDNLNDTFTEAYPVDIKSCLP